MAKPALTAKRLRELLHYDPETGIFTNLSYRGGLAIGARAGNICKTNGYARIGVDGVSYRANRLAWFYMTGKWPEGIVDHKNTSRSDDCFDNLRDTTFSVNSQNSLVARGSAGNRKRGASFIKSTGRWRANISTDGKSLFIGTFPTMEEAHAAYVRAKLSMHPEAVAYLINAS